MTTYDPLTSPLANNLICTTCGTQYSTTPNPSFRTTCAICDDPRQYVPSSGQSFTTLKDLATAPQNYHNVFTTYAKDERLISIHTVPKFAIGQRAILIRTPSGKNILWDCVTFLDVATVARINNLGGLSAIVISHPHYYSTHVQWSRAFGDVPVYLAAEDKSWTTMSIEKQVFITDTVQDILSTGVRAIKLGGHFPGSLVLLFEDRLLVADTLLTTPAGMGRWDVDATGNKRDRPGGLNTFAFMWSVPNSIPLSAEEIVRMWDVLKDFDFTSTHGAFEGQDIEDVRVKARVLESMQIQVRAMGWTEHAFLRETAALKPFIYTR
jgi:glyoxylase-like metal-dependent hydrolase (beta-lactamase superfamily II)